MNPYGGFGSYEDYDEAEPYSVWLDGYADKEFKKFDTRLYEQMLLGRKEKGSVALSLKAYDLMLLGR